MASSIRPMPRSGLGCGRAEGRARVMPGRLGVGRPACLPESDGNGGRMRHSGESLPRLPLRFGWRRPWLSPCAAGSAGTGRDHQSRPAAAPPMAGAGLLWFRAGRVNPSAWAGRGSASPVPARSAIPAKAGTHFPMPAIRVPTFAGMTGDGSGDGGMNFSPAAGALASRRLRLTGLQGNRPERAGTGQCFAFSRPAPAAG